MGIDGVLNSEIPQLSPRTWLPRLRPGLPNVECHPGRSLASFRAADGA